MNPPLDLVDAAVLALFRAGGRAVEDHITPPAPTFPYGIFYAIAGGGVAGPPLEAPEQVIGFAYQVTSVGRTPGQARLHATWMRGNAVDRDADGQFLAPLTVPAGWVCMDRASIGGVGGVDPAGDVTNRLYAAVNRYLITLTPAT